MDRQNATPDLQSILATLAEFAPPRPIDTPEVHSSYIPVRDQPDQISNSFGSSASVNKLSTEEPNLLLRPQNSTNDLTTSQQLIDPASITTWQDGLRCVTKIAAQNSQFSAAVKTMIERQRKTEMRWYSERQQLKQTQARRDISAAKAQSILASLNADSAQDPSYDQSSVSKDEELASFDRRIYTALQQMEKSMFLELKALGVPFFGTDPKLIVNEAQNSRSAASLADTHPKWSPPVTKAQLLALRKRMITHLEDLYKD